MAVKFPHVSVVQLFLKSTLTLNNTYLVKASVLGIDVSPTPIDEASFPPNLSLEIYDINLGLSHLDGQIDLLHMRCVAGGIYDMGKTLQDLQRCLKPGGLLLVVDGDVSTLCEDRKTILPLKRLHDDGGPEITGVSEQGSWFRRLFWGTHVMSRLTTTQRGLI
jgi:SAM-dependent methyltransferase